MKRARHASALGSLFLCWIVAGCASTTPKVDWDRRIGTYTLDDARKEFGEPNQVLRYNDGTHLAEWILSEGSVAAPPASASSPGGYGPRRTWADRSGMESWARSTPYSEYLHLTFSADDRLLKWEQGKK